MWRRGEAELALSVFEDAAWSGDGDIIARVELALGSLLLASGRPDAAADAFVRAIDAITRDDDETLFAATARLAALLQAHREQYQRILREASGRAAAYAVIGLAYKLELHDDIDAAKQACELAIASGRYQPARTAADALGRLLRVYEDIPNCKEEIARVGVPDRCSTEERSA